MSREPRHFHGEQPAANAKPRGIACSKCGAEKAWTIWTRYHNDPVTNQRYAVRGKECRSCKHRFQTTETIKD